MNETNYYKHHCYSQDGKVFTVFVGPKMPPHVWDGEKMLRLEPKDPEKSNSTTKEEKYNYQSLKEIVKDMLRNSYIDKEDLVKVYSGHIKQLERWLTDLGEWP